MNVHPLFAAILDAHFPEPEPVRCDCGRPATHFTEPMPDYDPCCDACFAEKFATCGHCGEVVPAGDTGTCEDGEDACTQCCRGWHEDEDAAYDRRNDW